MCGVSAEIRLDDDFFFIECDNGQDRGYLGVHGVRNGQKRILLLFQSFKYIPIVPENPIEGEKSPIECHQLKVTPSQPPFGGFMTGHFCCLHTSALRKTRRIGWDK
jgi:hypothetical protein